MLTPEQIKLVQESFAKVVPDMDRITARVYERLFALDPSLRPLFKGDMARQRSRLGIALAMVVHGLKNQAGIVPVLHELGRRHTGYGVQPEHYATVGEAVLGALEETLGKDFTPAVRQAWADAYDLIATTMINGAAGAGARVVPARRAA